MAYNITSYPEVSCLVVTCTGEITGDETLAANNEVKLDTECKFHLWDYLGADSFNATMQELHSIAIQDAFFNPEASKEKEAIVDRKNIMKKFIDVYSHLTHNFVGVRGKRWETKVFQSRDEAFNWFGIIDPETSAD